jgi:colicin import membrane protein
MSTLTAAVHYVRPPSADRLGAGALLALLVHAGLLAGLAAGVSWKRHTVPVVSAELWAAVPRIAGAAPAEPPAPPPPAPAPPPKPAAPAPAPVAPPPPPPAAVQREAQIALEQRKAAERKAAELEAARQRAEAERLARDKALRDKQLAAEKAAAEKAAADKKLVDKKAADKAAVDKADAERLQRLREANLARMRKELTSTPAPTPSSGAAQALPQPGKGSASSPGSGTAQQSAAPSAGYAGRIRARVLPNIIYNGPKTDTPAAEVVVNLAPDGRVISSRLLKSSGVPEWDREVLRAIERTEVLPRDIDGRVPAQIILILDPTER